MFIFIILTDDVTKIEVELEEAPIEMEDRVPSFVGPSPNPDLIPTPEVNATYPGGERMCTLNLISFIVQFTDTLQRY